MKRLLSIILAMMLLFATSTVWAESVEPTQEPELDYDFKEFRWGDSKDAVMEVEGEPLLDDKVNGMDATVIVYETTAVGLDMALCYYFCDEGLFAVKYILAESHSNESLYIDDYESFKNAMSKKYGTPLLDFEDWENDSKKEFYADDKGNALSFGYLTYHTIWMLDRTYISMDMSADNYDISMTVQYESTSISPGEADYSGDI